ncbi:hypothetical protein GOP47_0009166 [Adiantum capillus-veneris]|uniref:Peptidase A1 domain-containing protein n=1 Tax=Adiantum capillus-veneris TaxID=13818 RepID=A0A9D4UVQ4_ADICA|nr:hypothetical protein GOP47_0009166 [Adiantum capillus-veneris]
MDGEGNIKGFVIIKLPPPEDPSQKKTFEGALAFEESLNPVNSTPDIGPDPSSRADPRDEQHEEDYTLPLQRNDEILSPHIPTRRRRFRFRSKGLASVLFVAMVAYFLWQYGPSTVLLEEELETKNNDESEQPLVYSIYSKLMVYPSINSSWVSSIPAYPDNAVPTSPSAISKIIARDVVRHSTWLGTAAEAAPTSDSKETSTAIFPLRGNVYPDGLYYISARFGNPSREYFLDMDTGSDLTWLQCDAPCTSCAKGPHPLYKPRKANLVDCNEAVCSSVQAGSKFGCNHGTGQCDYEIMYADGGYSLGALVRDQLAMILTNRSWGYSKAVFGCAYNQQGSLAKSPTYTDGVMGLSSSTGSLPSQLAEQGIIKNMFAHCISGDGDNGGYLFLGDKLLPAHGITWASLLGKPATKNYVVAVEDVFFGDSSLRVVSKGLGNAIFDSGTSYTYLTSSLYEKITLIIQNSLVGSGFEHDMTDNTLPFCWKYKAAVRALKDVDHLFKPLVFEFRSSGWFRKTSKMQLTPEGYLIVNSRGNVCLGLLDGNVMGNDGPIIIGDISMRGILVVYDNENDRLGWMKTDCRKIPKSAVSSSSP